MNGSRYRTRPPSTIKPWIWPHPGLTSVHSPPTTDHCPLSTVHRSPPPPSSLSPRQAQQGRHGQGVRGTGSLPVGLQLVAHVPVDPGQALRPGASASRHSDAAFRSRPFIRR
ncbi:MAG: hypothetical protein MZU97_12545 [Bacillus subtilis]|nr:hypothetical protein [Bacillus subtilis]